MFRVHRFSMVCPTCRRSGRAECEHERVMLPNWSQMLDVVFKQSIPSLPPDGLTDDDRERLRNLPKCKAACCNNTVLDTDKPDNDWGLCAVCNTRSKLWRCKDCDWENTVLYSECVACGPGE